MINIKKQIIITIIITIIIGIIAIAYCSVYLVALGFSKTAKLIIISIIALIILAIVYNMKERIKEIKEEEKDDLSKYWLYSRERVRNDRHG